MQTSGADPTIRNLPPHKADLMHRQILEWILAPFPQGLPVVGGRGLIFARINPCRGEVLVTVEPESPVRLHVNISSGQTSPFGIELVAIPHHKAADLSTKIFLYVITSILPFTLKFPEQYIILTPLYYRKYPNQVLVKC